MKNILLAMSGGVDSSVAALLLRERGCRVTGAYIRTWKSEEEVFSDCPWQQEIEEARAVAKKIGIDFRVLNFIEEYHEKVVHYMVEGYRKGFTPNPDTMCNREMKFGVFLDYALSNGFEGVATGHYCRISHRPDNGIELLEGLDKNKDQSYFLALVRKEQLKHILFPIGDLTKPEVRQLAHRAKLPNADKKDSQGICFLGKVRIADFLAGYIEDSPGEIVSADGRVLGHHGGLHKFTLGQRRGIGVPSNTENEAYVVVAKDSAKNRLVVGFDQPSTRSLYTNTWTLIELNFLHFPPEDGSTILARPRYRDPATPITINWNEEGCATVHFHEPQRAIAPGQVCALYQGEQLLGGGIFDQSIGS